MKHPLSISTLSAFAICLLHITLSPSIAADADLAMTSFSDFSPNPIAAGGHPTSIGFQVLNYGPASVGTFGHVLLDMYSSLNDTFGDGDDVNIGTFNWATSLPAGWISTVTISDPNGLTAFTIPTGASGAYHVFLKISHTPTSGLSDPNPSDNWALLPTTLTVGVDTTRPTIQSINRLTPNGQFTSAASVVYRVTFSEHVNNVSTNDFTLVDLSGTITGESITSVSAGSGTTVDVTVNTGSSGDGDLRLDVLYPGAMITDDAGNSLDTSFTTGQIYSIARAFVRLAFFPLDTDPGWQHQGEWSFGNPGGLGGASHGHPDPLTGATGSNVLGINLNGDYSTAVGGPYYLTAGPFDFTGCTGVELQFQRWLNSDYQPYAYATIEMSTNGSDWSQLWANGTAQIADSAWTLVTYDISSRADNQPNIYVRWGHRVASSGAYAYSGWNIDDVEFLGLRQLPPPPLNVQASDGTYCSSVRVSWDVSAGATSYDVYREGSLVGSPTASPYDDSPGDTAIHSYSVKAKNGSGSSAASAVNSGWANAVPAAPTGVSSTDGTLCGKVRVSWTASVRATGYEVYRDGVFVANDAASPYEDTPGNTAVHSYTVNAKNLCGVSAASTANTGYANATPPVPTGVSATDGTLQCIVRVSWTASARATSYDVYRDGVFLGTDTASPYDDTPGDTAVHSYTVKAKNGCGTSASSTSNTGYAGDCAPPCTEAEWVTGFTPGTLRNDVGGWRGNRLKVGANPVEVRSLGRVFLNGNTHSHELRLVRVSDKAVVANVNWTPAGGVHNQIKHVSLAAAVTLAANTDYYLVSQETAGGDFFYSFNTAVSTTGVAAIPSAIYSLDGITWTAPTSVTGSVSYGPVGLTYCDVPQCVATLWVTGFTPGTLRNDVGGWRGNRLKVGANPVEVRSLGRVFLNGNTRSHELRLVRASDKAVVASVNWTPAGGVHNQIKHVALAAAVTLAANTDYYLVSQETAGGDFFYSFNTAVSTTGVAAIPSAIYSLDGITWTAPTSVTGSVSYGPVGFVYCDGGFVCVETPLVESFIPGTPRNDVSSWRGNRFKVGANPLEVRKLGRVFITGNTQNHTLRLVRVSDNALIASATWTPSGGTHNVFKYVTLAAPVTLAPNAEYYLVSQETAGKDVYYSFDTAVTTSSGVSVLSAIYSSDTKAWSVPVSGTGSLSYVPVSFIYCAPDVMNEAETLMMEPAVLAAETAPDLSSLVLAPDAIVVDGHLVLQYLRALPNPGVDYVIEASEDMATWSSTEGLIEESLDAVDGGIEYVQARYVIPMTETSMRYLRVRVVSKGD